MPHVATSDRRFAACATVITLVAWARLYIYTPGASPRDHALLAVFQLSTFALAAATFAPSYTKRWRAPLVVAYRLASHALPFDQLVHHKLLNTPPASGALGIVVDGIHMLLGSEAGKLLLLGAGLPLALPTHLAVHTLCLAIKVVQVPARCGLALLNNTVTACRIDVLHAWMGAAALGVVPVGLPAGGARCSCAAAAIFAQAVVGWLLPTYIVARLDSQHEMHAVPPGWQDARRQQELDVSRRREPDSSRLAGRVSGGSKDGGARQLSSQSGPSPAAAPPSRHGRSIRLARWLLDCVFLEGQPFDMRCTAWFSITCMLWLVSATAAEVLLHKCT